VQLTDFEALSFDCYGTLIDWEVGIAAALRPWADQHGLPASDEDLLAAFGEHEPRVEAAHPTAVYPEILAHTFVALGRRFGAEVTEADAAGFGASVPNWPPFRDSHDALVALSGRFKLLVLSNIDRASFAASNRLLDVHFDSILTAQDIGSYKPADRNFEALLAEARRLGVGPGRLLHVAQSLFHDHVPAKRAGLATVWINRRRGRAGAGATPAPPDGVQPDWEFPSMAAFAAAVDGA